MPISPRREKTEHTLKSPRKVGFPLSPEVLCAHIHIDACVRTHPTCRILKFPNLWKRKRILPSKFTNVENFHSKALTKNVQCCKPTSQVYNIDTRGEKIKNKENVVLDAAAGDSGSHHASE